MTNRTRVLVALGALLLWTAAAHAQAAQTEMAQTSKLTGISFGAVPQRDLRAQVISTGSDYLGNVVKQSDATASVSDVEVIFWDGAVKPAAVAAYEKTVTDNLAKAGYAYKEAAPQSAGGVVTTLFQATNQQGQIIGYWQASPASLYLYWGHINVSGPAAAAPGAAPAAVPVDPDPSHSYTPGVYNHNPAAGAPAVSDQDAQIAKLKAQLAALEAAKTQPANSTPANPAAAVDTTPAPTVTDTTPAGVAATATPVPVATVDGSTAAAQAPDNTPLLPLEQSAFVVKDATGALIFADKSGKAIDGLKLSQHDQGVASPSIAVAPDGTIHVAFVEALNVAPFANYVYHRSSSDGGKTWSEAKNLNEDMAGFDVGRSQVVVDSKSRVYVIWRAGVAETFTVTSDPIGGPSNLWYRELEGGKWSKAKPISEECHGNGDFNNASRSYFAAVDAAGRAQVVWNVRPDKWHPELGNGLPSIGNGLVFQSTLDGTTASAPREVFLPVVHPAADAWGHVSCDDLGTLNGYADSLGAAHFVALATMPMYGAPQHPAQYQLIENGRAGQGIALPDLSYHAARDIPTLLVDAKGRRHMIAMFLSGEHPNIRDYLLGSDDDPTVIRAVVGIKGSVSGFQAYQGPGGRMVALMQFDDNGDGSAGDNYVSTSTGDGKWSVPVNITNNTGRKTGMISQTSSVSEVMERTGAKPGPGAAAFDRDGHLLLVIIQNEYAILDSAVVGVNIAGGGVTTPTLRFLRF